MGKRGIERETERWEERGREKRKGRGRRREAGGRKRRGRRRRKRRRRDTEIDYRLVRFTSSTPQISTPRWEATSHSEQTWIPKWV